MIGKWFKYRKHNKPSGRKMWDYINAQLPLIIFFPVPILKVKNMNKNLKIIDIPASNKNLKIIDIPSSGESNWAGGAYSFFFVYSKYHGNFILRGYYKECEEYLKKNYTHYFVNRTLFSRDWRNRKITRNIWGFWKEKVGIFETSRRKGCKSGFEVHEYRSSWWNNHPEENGEYLTFKFKRMPHRWIPQFDSF